MELRLSDSIDPRTVAPDQLLPMAALPAVVWDYDRGAYWHARVGAIRFDITVDDRKAMRFTFLEAHMLASMEEEPGQFAIQLCDFIALDLPMPPSTNALFVEAAGKVKGSGRQRVKTGAYKAWTEAATFALKSQLRAQGAPPAPDTPLFDKHWCIWIRVNVDHGSDITNRIKALEDLLVAWKITCGDQWNDRCTIERDRSLPPDVECRAIIYRKVP